MGEEANIKRGGYFSGSIAASAIDDDDLIDKRNDRVQATGEIFLLVEGDDTGRDFQAGGKNFSSSIKQRQ